jgi:hypothetical protein
MNILPLVFAVMTVFALVCITFLKDVKGFHYAEIGSNNMHVTEKKVNNAIASKTYRDADGESIQKKASGTKKPKTFYSKRSYFPPFVTSKFNIAPLVQSDGDYKMHALYEPLAEMLRLHYKSALFKTEKIEYRLLDAILAKAKKFAESTDLAEFSPDDPALRSIYYKMLKGTNQYILKGTIPPLEDVVTLRKGAAAIHFSFASPVILKALFGDKIAKEITDEEQKKWKETNKYYFFSKDELQAVLMKNPILASKYNQLELFVDYSKEMPEKKEVGGYDKVSGLSMKKSLNLSTK